MAIRHYLLFFSALSVVSSFKVRWKSFGDERDKRLQIKVGPNPNILEYYKVLGKNKKKRITKNEIIEKMNLHELGFGYDPKDHAIRSIEEEELMLLKRRQLECLAEVRVDPDLVFKIKRGQWMTQPSNLLKEWALCALMKAGLMTRQGVYRLDVALEKVRDYDAKEVEAQIDACLSTKSIPAIDIAYNFVECYARSGSKFRLASIM